MTTSTTLPPDWAAMATATGRPFGEGGAYSSDCYADWSGCAALLHARGATLAGAENVLRSKHMRWCSDQWEGEYGTATVEHFAAYLDRYAKARRMAGIVDAPVGANVGALTQARDTFLALHRAAPIRRGDPRAQLACALYVEGLAAALANGTAEPEDLEEARALCEAWAAVGRALPPPVPAPGPQFTLREHGITDIDRWVRGKAQERGPSGS